MSYFALGEFDNIDIDNIEDGELETYNKANGNQ